MADKKTSKDEEKIESIPKEGELLPGQDVIEAGFGKIISMWFFPEFIKHQRGKYWYISAIIVVALLFVYSYFTTNPIFALFIIMTIVLYFWGEKKEPEYIPCLITENGIVIGDKFMEYENFENFYIIYNPPGIKNLYLQPKSNFKPRIALPLEDENPVTIRKTLLKYLDEDLEKEEMPASETISRILKI